MRPALFCEPHGAHRKLCRKPFTGKALRRRPIPPDRPPNVGVWGASAIFVRKKTGIAVGAVRVGKLRAVSPVSGSYVERRRPVNFNRCLTAYTIDDMRQSRK